MDNYDSFRKILEVSVNAPSGDNSQPWRFKFDGNSILVFNLESRDPTLYNFKQRGSYFSHGALAENIVIAAGVLGYSAKVEAFPGLAACTARISFEQSLRKSDPLYEAIPNRATNRKPYQNKKLDENHKKFIFDSANGYENVSLKLAEDESRIKMLAESISLNERLVMENRQLHDFLFGMIRWSEEEEKKTPGLYIKTMEFPPPQRAALRVLRHWQVVRIFNLIGFSKLVPKGSAQLYKSSSAIGAVILGGDSDKDFWSAGRAFQRVWLTATNLGLSIQPITAIPYLAQRVAAGAAGAFSPGQIEIINRAYGNISKTFGLSRGENIAMVFRIGYDGLPSARSSKLPPEIIK